MFWIDVNLKAVQTRQKTKEEGYDRATDESGKATRILQTYQPNLLLGKNKAFIIHTRLLVLADTCGWLWPN